ncbi:MAG: hypothetical protein JNL92_01635 [Opitutaceae bacterium]|nr:hypothetical protein [Opitutaceae bacterium]
MPLLRILLTGIFAAIAVVAGMFIAAIGLIAMLIGRLLGRRGGVQVRTQFAGRQPTMRPKGPAGSGDVIDVMATEVPADPLPR